MLPWQSHVIIIREGNALHLSICLQSQVHLAFRDILQGHGSQSVWVWDSVQSSELCISKSAQDSVAFRVMGLHGSNSEASSGCIMVTGRDIQCVNPDFFFFLLCDTSVWLKFFDCRGIHFKEACTSAKALWNKTLPDTQLDQEPGCLPPLKLLCFRDLV